MTKILRLFIITVFSVSQIILPSDYAIAQDSASGLPTLSEVNRSASCNAWTLTALRLPVLREAFIEFGYTDDEFDRYVELAGMIRDGLCGGDPLDEVLASQSEAFKELAGLERSAMDRLASQSGMSSKDARHFFALEIGLEVERAGEKCGIGSLDTIEKVNRFLRSEPKAVLKGFGPTGFGASCDSPDDFGDNDLPILTREDINPIVASLKSCQEAVVPERDCNDPLADEPSARDGINTATGGAAGAVAVLVAAGTVTFPYLVVPAVIVGFAIGFGTAEFVDATTQNSRQKQCPAMNLSPETKATASNPPIAVGFLNKQGTQLDEVDHLWTCLCQALREAEVFSKFDNSPASIQGSKWRSACMDPDVAERIDCARNPDGPDGAPRPECIELAREDTIAQLERGNNSGCWNWYCPGQGAVRQSAWAVVDRVRGVVSCSCDGGYGGDRSAFIIGKEAEISCSKAGWDLDCGDKPLIWNGTMCVCGGYISPATTPPGQPWPEPDPVPGSGQE